LVDQIASMESAARQGDIFKREAKFAEEQRNIFQE
jgi:hypothetical protein